MTDHTPWLERVLALEHLEDSERRETEAHLAGCAACRAARERLVALESGARLEGAIALDAPAPADAAARAAEAASLAALLARAESRGAEGAARAARDAAPPAGRPDDADPAARHGAPAPAPRVVRFPRWARLAAPVAAAAAVLLVLLWPRPGPERVLVRDAAVERASGPRGGFGGGFRAGDAFALRARLERPGVPIVVHVGPDGTVTLLAPRPGEPLVERPAGAVTFPDPASGVLWTVEGAGGVETFLVAAAPARGLDPAALERDLATVADRVSGHTERVQHVVAWLNGRFGQPAVTGFTHLD